MNEEEIPTKEEYEKFREIIGDPITEDKQTKPEIEGFTHDPNLPYRNEKEDPQAIQFHGSLDLMHSKKKIIRKSRGL